MRKIAQAEVGLSTGTKEVNFMDLRKALKDIKFDKRLVGFNQAQGQLSDEDLQKYIEALPDLTAQSEPLDLESNRSERDRFS